METVPAKITPKLVMAIDELVSEGWYANRSEAIRDAVRGLVQRLKAEKLEHAIREDVEWGLRG